MAIKINTEFPGKIIIIIIINHNYSRFNKNNILLFYNCFFFNKYYFNISVVPLPVAISIIIVLSLCCASCYDGEFVFDDAEAIVNNNDVQEAPIWKIFENDFWGLKLTHENSHKSYRPLTTLTFR